MANQATHTTTNRDKAAPSAAPRATHQRADLPRIPKRQRAPNRPYDPAHVRTALASGIAEGGVQAVAFALKPADQRRLAATAQAAVPHARTEAVLRVKVAAGRDAIEVHGVRASAIDNDQPDRLAIFSRGRDGVMESIGECSVKQHDVARSFARAIVERIGVPLNDCYLAAQLTAPRRPVGADLRALVGTAHRNSD